MNPMLIIKVEDRTVTVMQHGVSLVFEAHGPSNAEMLARKIFAAVADHSRCSEVRARGFHMPTF
jgi:hypothetical protein